jgi:hypothetical protein
MSRRTELLLPALSARRQNSLRGDVNSKS